MATKLYTPTLEKLCDRLETALPEWLPGEDPSLGDTAAAMRYACLGGGKRLRGVLVLGFCQMLSGDAVKAIPFAAAIEMMHGYSLVHDDLPCMDNSPLRRGRPSTHAAFGETVALLAGDGLQCRAFETMLNPRTLAAVGADKGAVAAGILADAAGIDGMVGGQTVDLAWEHQTITLPQLEMLQAKKTGALIAAACEMGAVLGGADEIGRLAAVKYGRALGRCFQIVDDLLDASSTAEEMGKPTGADEAEGKNTYVSLLGVSASRELAQKLTDEAVEALCTFGDAAEDLKYLANALVGRTH